MTDENPSVPESDEREVSDSSDPSVPTELLELHLELEDKNVTPKKFQEVYGS